MTNQWAGMEGDIASMFKQAMRGVASTVTVITARDHARLHGMTATAVMSVSMAPPSLAICINQNTLLHDVLISSRQFCVNILDEQQVDVSAAFSGALGPQQDRFQTGQWSFDGDGPGFLDDAQANLLCSKVAAMPYGTHTLFIGEVTDIRLAERQNPLVYLNAGYCPPRQLQRCD